ncbi:asparaginase [Lederbergia citrea]|uniref:asparaginase n=1 Tax=Lederbergia citrea TaxID=2833581 RepID=A0A942Z278_9BACI|nr:asparaginase [Lederbergia citrea]MBS4203105.1 asparaginase [Lederbergia citrea]MBS4222223.1 asparaginase [Lederbergia citrea]
MKRILVIHTGGTIAMQEDSETGAVSPGRDNPLLIHTEQISKFAQLSIRQPFHLPSPHITISEMLELKNVIDEESQKQHTDGIVITHGTDTLEETAYFLDLTVHSDIPIVVTGAMRSSNEIGSDGLYNYISSIRVACTTEAKGKGVLVVLNDEIHTAMNVTKTHASNVSTFQSPQYGPIGIVTKQAIIFHHQPTYKEKYDIHTLTKNVVLIKAYAGMNSDLLSAINDMKVDGVVIEGLGQGNLPPAAMTGVEKLIHSNIPIVLVSRCFNGIAQDIYSYQGGGKQLKDMGVIFCNGLNGQKARIKLLVALTQTNDIKKLNELFSK